MSFSVSFLRGVAAFILAALTAFPALADESSVLEKTLDTPDWLTIKGSHRTRFEVLHNPEAILRFSPPLFLSPADEVTPSSFTKTTGLVSLQTSIFAEVNLGVVRFGAELMDSRAYTPIQEFGGSCVNFCYLSSVKTNAVEPIQAYVAINFSDDDELMVGRFTMNIGSGRLIARSPFRNNIQSYYGVKGEFGLLESDHLTLFYTMPTPRSFDFDNEIHVDRPVLQQHFWGIHYKRPHSVGETSLEAYLYGRLGSDFAGCGNIFSGCDLFDFKGMQLTPGLRLYKDALPGRFDFDIETALQFKTDNYRKLVGFGSTPTYNTMGFFAHAEFGRSLKSSNMRVSLLADVASGPSLNIETEQTGNSVGFLTDYEGPAPFDPLFGDFSRDFGPEGLFGALSPTNILSAGFRLEAIPVDRSHLQLTYHIARPYNDHYEIAGGFYISSLESGWSHQIDLQGQYWIVPEHIAFKLGGAVFTNTGMETVNSLAPDIFSSQLVKYDREFSFYGYSSLTFSF